MKTRLPSAFALLTALLFGSALAPGVRAQTPSADGFDPGVIGTETSVLAEQADGKILVGGFFSTLAGQRRRSIGRLNATEPATQSLSSDGSAITWLRGGTSPEVCRTTFEHSPDGAAWTLLGAGTRVPGGWQLTGLPLPPGGQGPYQVQQTATLGDPGSWQNVGDPVEANSMRIPLVPGPQFLRVRE